MPPEVALLRRLGLLAAVPAAPAAPLGRGPHHDGRRLGVRAVPRAARWGRRPGAGGAPDHLRRGPGVRTPGLAASGVQATHLLRDPGDQVSGGATSAGPVEGQVAVAAHGRHPRWQGHAGWPGARRAAWALRARRPLVDGWPAAARHPGGLRPGPRVVPGPGGGRESPGRRAGDGAGGRGRPGGTGWRVRRSGLSRHPLPGCHLQ